MTHPRVKATFSDTKGDFVAEAASRSERLIKPFSHFLFVKRCISQPVILGNITDAAEVLGLDS